MSRDERLGTQERVLDEIDTISSAVGFAGMYFDDDCGGVPVFLTAGDPEAFERFVQDVLPSTGFVVRVVERSMDEVDAVYQEVMAAWTPTGPMARVSGVGYDIPGNRISVGIDGDPEPVQELLSRLGTAVVVAERPFSASDE